MSLSPLAYFEPYASIIAVTFLFLPLVDGWPLFTRRLDAPLRACPLPQTFAGEGLAFNAELTTAAAVDPLLKWS